jgi:diacylglycerol kinase family enzyme
MASPHLVFNANAGTVLKIGQESLTAAIKESGLSYSAIHFLDGKKIGSALSELKKESPVLLGGGDGSFMYAAKEFLDTPGRLGILPMGTMNLLANELNVPTKLEDALHAYAQGTRTETIDVGMVNEWPFLCFATLGLVPETAKLREEKRKEDDPLLIPRLAMYIFPKLDMPHFHRYRLVLDGRKKSVLRTPTLVISNNLFVKEGEPQSHAFAKHSLQDGKLGIYSLKPRSFWDKLRILLRIKFGQWKNEPVMAERTATRVEVKTHRREETITLDGEPMDLSLPLKFSIQPSALTLLLPALPTKDVS